MRRKNWKRIVALVVAGTVCQFGIGSGACLSLLGQSVLAGAGFTTGAAFSETLGLADLITGLVPDGDDA